MNSHDGALLVLFQKTVSTPTNLKALFDMCDPAIRTGSIRCDALQLLYDLANLDSVWKLQVPGNGPREAPSSFGKKLIENLINTIKLEQCFCGDCSDEDSQGICYSCFTTPWLEFCICFPSAIGSVSPNEVLDMFNTIQDWPRRLQAEDMFVYKTPDQVTFCDVKAFIILHHWPCRLLANDPTNIKAKTFLREQVGSCHELLRKVLRHIISVEIFPSRATPKIQIDAMRQIGDFLSRFLQCLVPVPVDRETMSLVRRARNVLKESNTHLMTQWHDFDTEQHNKLYLMHELLCSMARWHDLHNESEQAQWKRFHDEYISGINAASDANTKKLVKKFRKNGRKVLNAQRNIEDGEMCANCFVLEKTLLEESNQAEGLMKCTRCRQMKYCSRECQVEHWTKAHKKQCKKVEKAAAASSSSEPK